MDLIDVRSLVLSENNRLRDKLRALDKDSRFLDVRLGAELEFYLPEHRSTAFVNKKRAQTVSAIQKQADRTPDAVRRAFFESRALTVRTFSGRELFMFDVLSDPQWKGWLQPLFGAKGPQGYYDGNETLELKTLPCDEAVFPARLAALTTYLKEKGRAYGFDPAEIDDITIHMNYSLYDAEGVNLFAPNARRDPLLQRVTTGIAYAMEAAAPFLDMGRCDDPVYMHPGRQGFIRMAPNRMELRFNRPLGSLFVESVSMAVLAGALYGASPRDGAFFRAKVPQTQIVRAPLLACRDPALKVLRHVLEGCIVGKNGFLVPPEKYLQMKDAAISYKAVREMGFTPRANNFHLSKQDDVMTPRDFENLVRQIRVVETKREGLQWIWPRTRSCGLRSAGFEATRYERAFTLLGLRPAATVCYVRSPLTYAPALIQKCRAFAETLSPTMKQAVLTEPDVFLGLAPESRWKKDAEARFHQTIRARVLAQ